MTRDTVAEGVWITHTSKTAIEELIMEPQLVGVRVVFEDETAVELRVTAETREALADQFTKTEEDRLYVRIVHFFGHNDGISRIFACALDDIKFLT